MEKESEDVGIEWKKQRTKGEGKMKFSSENISEKNNWIYFTFFYSFSSAVSLNKTFLYCYSGIYTTWKSSLQSEMSRNLFILKATL